jgi:ADP-heptose:LPS heptosyltransferase
MDFAATSAVVMSPFANERIREWPIRSYRDLIEMIWRVHGFPVVITGTRNQRVLANILVRDLPSDRVMNACGMLSWDELVAAIDAAPYVIANNSGVAHLAAGRGRWTLCIFGASHAYNEWMPRGERVVVVSRVLPCSPCEIGADLCPNGIACMAGLQADDVFWRFHEAYSDALGATSGRERIDPA